MEELRQYQDWLFIFSDQIKDRYKAKSVKEVIQKFVKTNDVDGLKGVLNYVKELINQHREEEKDLDLFNF